ncbi:MAG TPA: LysR family transcriptional regulator [Gammaproteobacteria bacterium]|nr:LysR family transcriptional regulator [Gammaproteobacteria bacterium]
MQDIVKAGQENTQRIFVEKWRTIALLGEDSRVYSTPSMLHDIEVTSHDLIKRCQGEGEDSVGMSATVNHLAATPLGMWVDITVRITAVAGRKVDLEFECRDASGVVANGVHSRFMVSMEKTASQIRAKAVKYKGAV